MFGYAGVCVKEAEKGWCLASSRFDQGLKEPGSKVKGFLFLCVIEYARVFLCVGSKVGLGSSLFFWVKMIGGVFCGSV